MLAARPDKRGTYESEERHAGMHFQVRIQYKLQVQSHPGGVLNDGVSGSSRIFGCSSKAKGMIFLQKYALYLLFLFCLPCYMFFLWLPRAEEIGVQIWFQSSTMQDRVLAWIGCTARC